MFSRNRKPLARIRPSLEQLESRVVLTADPTQVCVYATDPQASETGDPALFTFYRVGGDQSQPLAVYYSVGGSATPGEDFAPLAGVAEIPAGQSSVSVPLNPIDDGMHEGDDSVVLSLLTHGGYAVGRSGSAAAVIADKDPMPAPTPLPTTDQPLPVLLVIANTDFYYLDYSEPRAAIEAAGLEVVVAASSMDTAVPHWGSGQGADGGHIRPDLAIADADAADYSAIVFVGGWGASSYQYAFEGTYHNSAYNGDLSVEQATNDLINDFIAQDKYVAALCHGVSVLAWARVDGVSPLAGRTVSAYAGMAPGSSVQGATSTRWHVEINGATMVASGSIGDPTTVADDVVVDGKIITAEDYRSGYRFGEVVAHKVLTTDTPEPPAADPLPVLLVIANNDFYYREYAEPRQALEEAGISVVVAAGVVELSTPHWNTGQGVDGGHVMPDLALADVDPSDYSAIVFVGGWGASQYQYAFEGTYHNSAYNSTPSIRETTNDLINDFIAQDKPVTAICHGVSVLAWARVDGVSPLAGRTVVSYAGAAPGSNLPEAMSTRWHIEANGATMLASESVGDPTTAADDVWIDGNIITAENYDSAYYFGQVLAERLLA